MMNNNLNISGYFSPTERALEKEESRQRDIADLTAGRLTLQQLNQRNRAIAKMQVKQCQVRSWAT